MKIIKPFYQIESDLNSERIYKAIESAGRVCYQSSHRTSQNSAANFVEMILKRGHESVIEHQSATVRFVVDRGVSHEIVRHRLCAFSQESTRFCNYNASRFGEHITFIQPCWIDYDTPQEIEWPGYSGSLGDHDYGSQFARWIEACLEAEHLYFELSEAGWKPEQARSVLPNSLKTEIVVTANLREWRHIFKLRTSKAAHPQMREVMIPLLADFQESLPILFDEL
jgi:thymidylate synthase (FAD)